MSSLFIVAILSGCVADDSGRVESDETTTSPTGTNSTANTTMPMGPPVANLTVEGNTSGMEPLMVFFNLANDGGGNGTFWSLEFGDGNFTNGTTLPSQASYTYQAGNYTVLFTIEDDIGDESTDSVDLVVTANATAQTEYSGGPFLGCVTELGAGACGAVILGTDNEDFGLWIQLEPGHIGMKFVADSGGDSDGWFFADPGDAPLESVHNGENEATGVVPPEALWLLVVPWVEPADEIIVTFSRA